MRRMFLPVRTLLFIDIDTTAQTFRIAEVNTEQSRRPNRDKMVVLLPGGILEKHDPYLPAFTDGYRNERLTKDLARAFAATPEHNWGRNEEKRAGR